MQPAAPASPPRKRTIAVPTCSSCQSNPLARVPKPRKAALKQAKRTIRRYFLWVLTSSGAIFASAVRYSRGSLRPPVCGCCASPFFVTFTFFYGVWLSGAPHSSRCVVSRNLAHLRVTYFVKFTMEMIRMPREPEFRRSRRHLGC